MCLKLTVYTIQQEYPYTQIYISVSVYIYIWRERESYCTLIQELHVSCYQETLVSIPIVPGFPAINTKHQNVLQVARNCRGPPNRTPMVQCCTEIRVCIVVWFGYRCGFGTIRPPGNTPALWYCRVNQLRALVQGLVSGLLQG